MRSLLVVCILAVTFVAFGAVAAQAADLQKGQVSEQTLAAMGLGGMQQLSDTQGQQIRGKGFVKFFGPITVNINIIEINAINSSIVVLQGNNNSYTSSVSTTITHSSHHHH